MELPELIESFSNADRKAFQETTLSKDILSRFMCNTLSEAASAIEIGGPAYDAVVIGSGMYGAACAERIYNRGGRVLVLDAGPFVISEHIENLANPDYAIVEADGLIGAPAFGHFRSPLINNGDPTPIRLNEGLAFSGHNYNIGGKSIRWGGWAPRLTGADLGLWPTEMAQYLKDYYREIEFSIGAYPTADFINGVLAQALLRFLLDGLPGRIEDVLAVLPPPIAVQAEQPVSGLFSFDKYSSLPALIDRMRPDAGKAFSAGGSPAASDSRRSIMLLPRCRVVELTTEPFGDGKHRVSSLLVYGSYQTPYFQRITIPNTCSVVLAANSLESTRLAMHSFGGLGIRAGGLMGRNFQVHLRTDLEFRIGRDRLASLMRTAAERRVDAECCTHGPCDPADPPERETRIKEILEYLEVGASHIQCETVVDSDGESRRYHLQLFAASDVGGNAQALTYRQDPSLPQLLEAIGSQGSELIALKFICVAEMRSDFNTPVGDSSGNWVNLAKHDSDTMSGRSVDGAGQQSYSIPKLYTHFALDKADEELWLRMDNKAIEIAEALAGDGPIEYKVGKGWRTYPPTAKELLDLHQHLGSTYHEAGTLWMGDNPNASVVNTHGRFHDITNVYCCDQAVFPTSGSANPVPTGLVVARRVSEAIIPDETILEDDFESLFDFPSPRGDYPRLDVSLIELPRGWRHVGPGGFIRRGNRVETDGGIGMLYYRDRTFKDFILRLQYRCPNPDVPRPKPEVFNNSGVYVRWPDSFDIPGVGTLPLDELTAEQFDKYAIRAGYEIQIDDTGFRPTQPTEFDNPFHRTGAIYPVDFGSDTPMSPLPSFDNAGNVSTGGRITVDDPTWRSALRPPGDWNDYEISAEGSRIRVTLNGVTVSDNTDRLNVYQRGYIALQNHFNGYRVQFRNLRIREL